MRRWSWFLVLLAWAACGDDDGSSAGGDDDQTSSASSAGGGGGTGTGTVAAPCDSGDDCLSGVCIPSAAGETAGTCAGDCPGAAGDPVCAGSDEGCLPGWSLWSLSGDPPLYCLCVVQSLEDTCNASDDDCDGLIDEEGDSQCEAEGAELQCQSGYCQHCPVRCDGLCTDLTTDVDHCGDCATSCPGGTAMSEPFCSETGCLEGVVVAAEDDELIQPRVDATSIYFRRGIDYLRCPQSGCDGAPELLTSIYYANSVHIVDDVLYWAAEGVLGSCPLSDCDAGKTILGNAPNHYYRDFVLVNDTIYVAASNGDVPGIISCPTSGCAADAPIVVTNLADYVETVASDGVNIYFAESGSSGALLSCPLSGCASPTVVYQGGDVTHTFALNDDELVFAAADGIWRCATSGCATPTAVVENVGIVTELAIDGDTVFFKGYSDRIISSCPLAGCSTPTSVAAAGDDLGSMAVTPSAIFVTSFGTDAAGEGKVFRVDR